MRYSCFEVIFPRIYSIIFSNLSEITNVHSHIYQVFGFTSKQSAPKIIQVKKVGLKNGGRGCGSISAL